MKITLIGPVYPYRGGIAHHTAMLAQALQMEQHSVQVVSFKRQYPAWLYPGISDKDPSQQAITTPAQYLLDPLYPWTWEQAVQTVHAFEPKLILTQWWTTFWAIPFTFLNYRLSKGGVRTGYIIHNVMPHEQRAWDHWLATSALRQGQAFIAQTRQEAERLSKILPAAKVSICPIPPYSMLKTKSISKETAREQLGWPEEGKIFLFFGIVRAYKGLRVLLEAFGNLRQKGIYPRLVIAGEFWEDKTSYIQQIERLQLTSQVTILDQYIPNEQLPTLFSAADCLVAPYTGGTQSAVVSAGLPYELPMIVTEQIAEGILPENRQQIVAIPAGDSEAFGARP